MSRKFHGGNCYMCPHFNPKNEMGEECESEEHAFCSVGLKKHDKEVYNRALEDLYKTLEKSQQDNWIDNLEYGIALLDVEEAINQLKEDE